MASDLVRRLCELAEDHFEYGGEIDTALWDAAKRIVRLEAALREIGEKLSLDRYDNEHCLETVCGELARAALEGKDGQAV